MVSMRGPRRCASTLTSTSSPSTEGVPTLISSPLVNSRTRSSFRDEPGSAARRSTRMWSPGATRYCFPPLTTTADSEPSGLGTASDCTKLSDRLVHAAASHRHRLDEAKRSQHRDGRRSAVGDQRERDARDRKHPDVHADVLDHLHQDHHEHPAGEQLAEPVPGDGRSAQKPDQKGAEKGQEDEAAEQPELLGEDRKDEVGGALRHKPELALQAVQPSLAEQAS